MSTYRGIALVTEVLRYLLVESAPAVPGTDVRIGSPAELQPGDKPEINIFLYAVAESALLRNADLPTRNAGGELMRDQTVALELDYLISFTGSQNSVESELLLGAVMHTLHSNPAIGPDLVRAVTEEVAHHELSVSDLGYPVDISALHLTSGDRSHMWSTIQAPYKLSLAYRVRAVMFPSDATTVGSVEAL